MGLFDFFKNKKEDSRERHYNPTNITVRDLGKRYIFDYDLETWTVESVYEQDWGNNYFTRELIIKSGNKERFLSLEDDGGLIVTLSEKVKFRKLGEEVCDYIDRKNKPPKQIEYNGVTYYRTEKSPGYSKEVDAEFWDEFISYSYMDEEEEKVLSIEQYDDNSFEVSVGEIIDENKISNILPIETEY